MKPALKELLLIHVEVMDKGKLGLYPERHSTKTPTGEQQKFYNTLVIVRPIAV